MSLLLKRKDVILTIVAFCFGLTVIPYFFEVPALETYANNLNKIVTVIITGAFTISLYAQTRRNVMMIKRRSSGWLYQVLQLILVYLMISIGLFLGQTSIPYTWLIEAFVMPCSVVLYSIATFYMISAGARAFRARNFNSLLFLLAAVLVLFAQAPMTESLMPWPAVIREYLGSTFGKTVGRVFGLGLSISVIVLGVRTLLGKEPATLGILEEVGE